MNKLSGISKAMVFFLLMPISYADMKWPVEDRHFNQCLTRIAQKEGWSQPSDFTTIKCHKENIVSINGIENFRSLEVLSLFKNDIIKLPTVLPSLLKSLNVSSNKLTEVNLTNYPKLHTILFFKNNITSLELNNLPSLRFLKANDNEMTRITLKQLPKLNKVYLFNNQLPIMDLEIIQNIDYMDVRQNPMSDEFYDRLDEIDGATILHDGNADDW